MDERELEVLRDNHGYLVDNLDPLFLRPFLYTNGLIRNETYLDSERNRLKRAEKFLKRMKKKCSFSLFIEALNYQKTYTFIAKKLQSDLGVVHKQQKIEFFERREEVISFRHEIKRCINKGNKEEFKRLYEKAITDWREAPKEDMSISDRQYLADLYFVAIDSEIDRQRVTYTNYQASLYSSSLFEDLARISVETSTPTLPTVMKQVRYGSALIMAGFPLEHGIGYIQQAKQMMEVLPACFETGTVLYIEFNTQLQMYQQSNIPIDKERMSLLGSRAIEHFAREGQEIGDDFKRTVTLKIAYTKLGIGIFLDFIESKGSVTETLLSEACDIVKTIKRSDNWSRMERRAKMVYYSIMSRIMQIKERPVLAIQYSEISLKYAKKGKFKKEILSIQKNIKIIKEED